MNLQANRPRIMVESLAPMFVQPVTLEGQFVRLEPLTMDHHAALCEIALDEELWRWTPRQIKSSDDLQRYIELASNLRAEGSALPFATIYIPENRVVGSTRYLSIEKQHHRIEIGSTFVGRQWQRTVVNTEAKYLLLRHAFETLACFRVEFQTDALNAKSRAALLRIGAQQEGIFRNHKICADGRIRDSVFYSIIDTEWSSVKANLEAKISR